MTAVDRLAGIEAQLEAATDGPWTWDAHRVPTLSGWRGDEDYRYDTEVLEAEHYGECGCRSACELSLNIEDADAEFIAAAPDTIRYLLDLVKAQRAQLDTAGDELDDMTTDRDYWEQKLGRLIYSLASVEEIGEWSSMNDPAKNLIDHVRAKVQTFERQLATTRKDALNEAADKLDALWGERRDKDGRDWTDGVEESETLLRALADTPTETKGTI